MAIRSIPVVAVTPPLGVDGVATERATACAPFAPWALPHVFARMGASDFPWTVGLPPGLPVVPPYFRP
jgi:hypothetical protein